MSGTSAWRTLGVLLRARWRSLLNSGTRAAGLRLRVAVLLLLGIVFWGGLFGASYWFLDQSQRVEVFGDVLVEQLSAMALLVLFSVLVFSNLVSSFSAYFLSEDLSFLMARPLQPYAFYSARFLELMVQSSWMAGLFALPIFLSMGIVYGVNIGFYVELVAALLPLFVIATAVATVLSLLMTNLMPARRTREVLLLLAAVSFVGLFIVLRALRPERFLNPDERAGMIEVLSTLSAPRATALPSEWVHRALWPLITGQEAPRGLYLGTLYATAAGLFFVGAWVFRALHFDGYSKACEGRPEGSAPERVARRLLWRRGSAAQRAEAHLDRLRRRRGPLRLLPTLWRKDARTFIRDTAQWTQLVLLGALVVIYLLNFKYVQTVGEGGFIGKMGLYFANVSLSAFVVTAVSVRFVFPVVSLEGRAFWLVKSAPLPTVRFLRAKWGSAAIGIWSFGQLLTLTSNAMIGVEPALHVAALAFQTSASLGVVGLGVGLGAIYPRFDMDNAAKIATGFGGFAYMVAGVLLALSVVVLSAQPTSTLLRLVAGSPVSASRALLAIGLTLVAFTLPVLVARLAISLGAKRLDE